MPSPQAQPSRPTSLKKTCGCTSTRRGTHFVCAWLAESGLRSVGCGYPGGVRLATWNVNSAKIRVPRLLPWLDERQPDVVCLQETKLADDAFTALLGADLTGRGAPI